MADAGLRKENIDGLVTRGSDISPMDLAEYMGLHVGFCEGVTQHGPVARTRGGGSVGYHAGLANTVLCVLGGSRDPAVGGFGPGDRTGPATGQQGHRVRGPFGPAAGATQATP